MISRSGHQKRDQNIYPNIAHEQAIIQFEKCHVMRGIWFVLYVLSMSVGKNKYRAPSPRRTKRIETERSGSKNETVPATRHMTDKRKK